MRNRSVTVVFLAAMLTTPSAARSQSIVEAMGSDLKYGVLDILSVWTSPFRGDLRGYGVAALVAVGFGALLFADESVGNWIRENQRSDVLKPIAGFRDENRLGLAHFGSSPRMVLGTGAIYLVGLFANKPGMRDAAMGCIASLQADGIPRRKILYTQVGRERPLVLDTIGIDTTLRAGRPYRVTDGTDSWWDNSFYAGHVMNITACVSFWTHRFDLGLAEPALWLVAGSVGLARMADQRHWLSDTFLGAAIGTAIGRHVAKRSDARRAKRDGETTEPGGLFLSRQGSNVLVGWRVGLP